MTVRGSSVTGGHRFPVVSGDTPQGDPTRPDGVLCLDGYTTDCSFTVGSVGYCSTNRRYFYLIPSLPTAVYPTEGKTTHHQLYGVDLIQPPHLIYSFHLIFKSDSWVGHDSACDWVGYARYAI